MKFSAFRQDKVRQPTEGTPRRKARRAGKTATDRKNAQLQRGRPHNTTHLLVQLRIGALKHDELPNMKRRAGGH